VSTARGADLLVEALAGAGVRHLFSLSGNQILSVYDAALDRGLRLVHTRHEAAAVHMADGWGRMTEQPGVALVTAGPGHLNAVAALYTALMSESPLLLLSGHAPLGQRGRGAFQEIDQVGAVRAVTKAAWLVEDPAAAGAEVRAGLAIAAAWPPGPVHLSLPGDVLEGRVSGAAPARPPGPGVEDDDGAPAALAAILDILGASHRPLIVAGPAMGRGARWGAVQALAGATRIPALLLESPRGMNDPALRRAAARLPAADALLLLGKGLDYSLCFGDPPALDRDARVIHVDTRPPLAKERLTLALRAEPAAAAARLARLAGARRWPQRDWAREVDLARTALPGEWDAIRRAARRPLHPLVVAAALEPVLARGALVCDGGEFGQWIQAALPVSPRLINGPSGSIGSAIPMALGARLARPDLPVVAAVGDGTFGFHAFELDTAVRHGIPVVVVVGNDARWNAEHQLQLQQYGPDRAVGCELAPTRYDRVAEALGALGRHVERADELPPALDLALRSGRPACVNVVIDGAAAPRLDGRGERSGHTTA
jgi:acetolactate synthase-1/2/3 large subunit